MLLPEKEYTLITTDFLLGGGDVSMSHPTSCFSDPIRGAQRSPFSVFDRGLSCCATMHEKFTPNGRGPKLE